MIENVYYPQMPKKGKVLNKANVFLATDVRSVFILFMLIETCDYLTEKRKAQHLIFSIQVKTKKMGVLITNICLKICVVWLCLIFKITVHRKPQ